MEACAGCGAQAPFHRPRKKVGDALLPWCALCWGRPIALDPEALRRQQARSQVSIAVASGKLAPWPCQECGAEPTVAHHADYSRPLDVVWLCRAHHSQIHNQFAFRPLPEYLKNIPA